MSLEEKNFLQNEFKKQHYPNTDMVREFSDKLDLSYLQVRSWFQYYRRKYKYFQETSIFYKIYRIELNLLSFY